MKRIFLYGAIIIGILAWLLTAPEVTRAEIIYLRDGSQLVGRVLGWEGDSLLVETRFSPRPLRLHRDEISKISMDETAPRESIPRKEIETEPSLESGPVDSGIVHLVITGSELYSRVRYRRKPHREKAIAINKIYMRVFVNGSRVYEEVDSVMDKQMQRGGETEVRNIFKRSDYRIPAPEGTITFRVFVGNEDLSENEYRGGKDILATQVEIPDLRVDSGEETLVKLVGKKPFLGFGRHRLVWEPLFDQKQTSEDSD